MTTSESSNLDGPHQAIEVPSERERFALQLFDVLWDQYRQRVSYVQIYERVVNEAGAKFVNDHIAFRTFANQDPTTGISSLARVFEALDYRPAGVYHFPSKHLNAIHYQHPNSAFPKLFVSELKTWELSVDAQCTIQESLATHRAPLSVETLASLTRVDKGGVNSAILQELAGLIQELPWQTPHREAVEKLNAESQYAAWVLVHGYNVNHFTALVNSHEVDSLNNLEKTIAALREAGVPMKAEIEGERGSKLRQSATQAVTIDMEVINGGQPSTMPWTYAYFELAERNLILDPSTGKQTRFEGFLGPQATNLFEMTKVAK